jgi:cytoskeletal protein CcmA (bactofilin family)
MAESLQSESVCSIGEGIQIRGSLSGAGQLVVRGRIEGQITLDSHLTIEPSGTVVANVSANSITLSGQMQGDIEAAELVSVQPSATMQGDIRAQEVEIADGANFCGRLDMDVPLPDHL